MSDTYELGRMEPKSFEHLANILAMKVLGAGHTGFGPGADGGRDGYFEGDAPYPSLTTRWSGIWYIQSKFHKPHLSKNHYKWLLEEINKEIAAFSAPETDREWPDNWIIVTNIDPSGAPETGVFDKAKALVKKARPALAKNFHIWGGRKVLDLLIDHPKVAAYYGHFLTPGNVLQSIHDEFKDKHAEIETILQYLLVTQLKEQQFTKLSQAGSKSDARPGIHQLFVDLPFDCEESDFQATVIECLSQSSARCHKPGGDDDLGGSWSKWNKHPTRGRVWVIKGGPGQGKSTISQFFSQVHRAALLSQSHNLNTNRTHVDLADEIRQVATRMNCWPSTPRIPIVIELKDYAYWFGSCSRGRARGVLTYFAERLSAQVEQTVLPGTIKRAFGLHSWFVTFDGLDEVPNDVKDDIAIEIRGFLDNLVVEVGADLLAVCTTRPQGYSGQFANMDGPTIRLRQLPPDLALACARPVIAMNRSAEDAAKSFEILEAAIKSGSVQELMTTPLQSHIMAVVVRDGGRPPERRWQLFNNFFQVMKQREANKNFENPRLAKLLREDQLLKAVHARLGFVLHARAETSEGAKTHLDKAEFRNLVSQTVSQLIEQEVAETVETVMEATTERLVLVSTPDDGNHVRFDIRQLQEFFAGEFLYQNIDVDKLRIRLELVAGDSHWREVVYFLLSALIESGRTTELTVMAGVLNKLNDGDDDDSYVQIFHKRMARGAFFVSRLLHEGVLEQDMRVRKLFGRSLTPILGLASRASYESLARPPPNQYKVLASGVSILSYPKH